MFDPKLQVGLFLAFLMNFCQLNVFVGLSWIHFSTAFSWASFCIRCWMGLEIPKMKKKLGVYVTCLCGYLVTF